MYSTTAFVPDMTSYNVFGGTLNPTLLLLVPELMSPQSTGSQLSYAFTPIAWRRVEIQEGWLSPTKRASAAKIN